MMHFKYLQLLPVVTSAVYMSTTITLYILTVIKEPANQSKVYPSEVLEDDFLNGFKIMSDCVSVTTMFSVFLIRYLQVASFRPAMSLEANLIAFLVGLFMLLGQCLATSWHIRTHRTAHYIGVAIHAICGCAYIIQQSYISRKHYRNHHKRLVFFRAVCAAVAFFCPVVYSFARLFSLSDKFFIKQISVCLMIVLFHAFICSFVWDFGKISVNIDTKRCRQLQIQIPTETQEHSI